MTEVGGSFCMVGAGNSAIVFTGADKRLVYRLRRKYANPAESAKTYQFDEYLKKRIICPLFGSEFLPESKVIVLNPDEAACVHQLLESNGYSQYASDLKSLSDSEGLQISVQTNSCFLSKDFDSFCDDDSATLCVELKPKCGTFPRQSYRTGLQSGGSDSLPQSLCRFCALQLHPRKAGRWPSRSSYCPIELFSGDHQRLRDVLRNLLLTPQNNLTFFVNGARQSSVEHDSNGNGRDLLESIACNYARGCGISTASDRCSNDTKILLSTFSKSLSDHLASFFCALPDSSIEQVYSDLIEILAESLLQSAHSDDGKPGNSVEVVRAAVVCPGSSSFLPANCVLERLLRAQALELRTGDSLMLQPELKSSYMNLSDADLWSDLLSDAADVSEPNKFLTRLFSAPVCVKPTESEQVGLGVTLLDRVRGYLLAALAKDVSLMISMRRLKHDADVDAVRRRAASLNRAVFVVVLNRTDAAHRPLRFAVQVTVIDTALKSVAKIEQHFNEDSALRRCLENL